MGTEESRLLWASLSVELLGTRWEEAWQWRAFTVVYSRAHSHCSNFLQACSITHICNQSATVC